MAQAGGTCEQAGAARHVWDGGRHACAVRSGAFVRARCKALQVAFLNVVLHQRLPAGPVAFRSMQAILGVHTYGGGGGCACSRCLMRVPCLG
jgi:hypothetical protein